jgi:hypothetical protein
MHIKHMKVLQPFSIIITHKYKYISNYSLLFSVTSHTSQKEFSIPTTHYKFIESHKNPSKFPLIFLLHKAT